MTQEAGVYPFSTADGKSIPVEVARVLNFKQQAFATGVSTALKDLPLGSKLFVFYSTEDCLLRFGTTVPNPPADDTSYSEMMILPKQVFTLLTTESTQFGTRGISANGNIYVWTIEKWSYLTLEALTGRR